MDDTVSTRNIRRLEESVINRIAAGEVIQRPANALKEMLENSLDAGSSKIQVTVKNGGLKLMQIQDNGSGIKKEDMLIVCERFTTSKLEKFEDLSSINTHGFRGEALASISHVAHLTITTRTRDSKCAYKGSYCDGKLLAMQPGLPPEPKPCAGNQGTQITVEDLFYNVSTRLKALRSPSEEYRKIADMMGKYAIHNEGVSFTLKKYGESVADIRTNTTNTVEDNISCIYGQSVARELLSVDCKDNKLGYKMKGCITSANYSVKKLIFLLFINHRLVDSSSIRKAIETVYSNYLPKSTHPFIYMSIEIAAANVDVNVHPTKHEVHFLHEDLITEGIQKCVEDRLLGCNSSRTYYTQALLPGAAVPVSLEETSTDKTDKPYAHQMVRTDHKELKLDAFFVPESNVVEQSIDTGSQGTTSITVTDDDNDADIDNVNSRKRKTLLPSMPTTQRRKKHYRPVHLDSVKNLIAKFNEKKHKDLGVLFSEHKFVGCIDQTKALVQHQTKLYLINMTSVTKELFYQLVLTDFANFDVLQLKPPPSLYELAILGLSSPDSGWNEEDGPKESLAEYVVHLMKTKADMLKDYFSFEINEDGHVLSVPMLLSGYNPNLDKLPLLILRLATEVNWSDEIECFGTFAREYAQFYCIEDDPFLLDSSDHTPSTVNGSIDPVLMKQLPWRWTMEHAVFSCLRNDFIPLKEMAENGTVLQISDLKDLYKVFERC